MGLRSFEVRDTLVNACYVLYCKTTGRLSFVYEGAFLMKETLEIHSLFRSLNGIRVLFVTRWECMLSALRCGGAKAQKVLARITCLCFPK